MFMLRKWCLAAAALALFACSEPEPVAADSPLLARHYRALGDQPMPVWQVAFSPDGRLLAGASADGSITLWSWPEAMVQRTLRHPGGATGIAFSPDGARLVSAGYDRALRVFSVGTGVEELALSGHAGTVWSVAFSPDGRLIASGGEDETVRMWDAGNGRLLRTTDAHARNVWSVRFGPDGRWLASGSFDNTAKVWDVASGRMERALVGHTEAVVEVAASPDGQWIATGGDDSAVRLWRVRGRNGGHRGAGSGSDPVTFSVPQHVYAVAFSPDSRLVASGGREKGALGTLLKYFLGRLGMTRDPTVRIWRVGDGALVAALSEPADDVHSVAFSPDGQWLAASGADRAVHVWRVELTSPRTGSP